MSYDILTSYSESVQCPPQRTSRSRTFSQAIPVTTDVVGCPALPSEDMCASHDAKSLQSMIREYCTAHIRE